MSAEEAQTNVVNNNEEAKKVSGKEEFVFWAVSASANLAELFKRKGTK